MTAAEADVILMVRLAAHAAEQERLSRHASVAAARPVIHAGAAAEADMRHAL